MTDRAPKTGLVVSLGALYRGEIDGVLRRADRVELRARLPHLDDHASVMLEDVTRFVWRPAHHTWEDEDIDDGQTIGQAGLVVRGTRRTREHDGAVVLVSDGELIVRAATCEVGPELLDRLREYWAAWHEGWSPSHPLLASGLRPGPGVLLDAWRTDRTSDLADALRLATPPANVPRLASLDDFAGWVVRWREHPTAALEELARCATSTFRLGRDLHVDEAAALCGTWWSAITRALDVARAEPDPRLGRAIEHSLYSPSDHWFRPDQVEHAVTSFEPTHGGASFADLALAAIEHHADAGTPARLRAQAVVLAIECDCNGAEMVSRLRSLADRIEKRYPADRVLSSDAHEALRFAALG